jgi:acetoin utilization deacetylase AcuC-like enzyme
VISLLEGGYDLDALARCVAAHVEALEQAGQPL